jgi:nucleoside triphosphate pyrophosphatase
MVLTPERLILASASTARAAILQAAGVEFSVEPASVDEMAIKREYRTNGRGAQACATALAEAKARTVAMRHPEALVIAADQILVADGEWFDKPVDLDGAVAQLRRLRGRDHVLVTAACMLRGEELLWQAIAMPKLTIRCFGEAFLARYIAAEGNAMLSSVGAYRIEGRGVQLFTRIEGDHFAILGLPLIELLQFLRKRGLLAE